MIRAIRVIRLISMIRVIWVIRVIRVIWMIRAIRVISLPLPSHRPCLDPLIDPL